MGTGFPGYTEEGLLTQRKGAWPQKVQKRFSKRSLGRVKWRGKNLPDRDETKSDVYRVLGSCKQFVQCSRNIRRKVWHVGGGNWSCSSFQLHKDFSASSFLVLWVSSLLPEWCCKAVRLRIQFCVGIMWGSFGDLVKMQILIRLPESCYSRPSLGQQHPCHLQAC